MAEYGSPTLPLTSVRNAASFDVFALGAVLFRCLAGTAPFDAGNTIAVLTRVLFEEPPPLWMVRPDLPASVHELVAKALAKPRDHRYGDGAELARALLDIAPDVASAAPPSLVAGGITGGEERILAAVLVRRPNQHVPEPDPPMTTTDSARPMSRSIPFSTFFSPNDLTSPRTAILASAPLMWRRTFR